MATKKSKKIAAVMKKSGGHPGFGALVKAGVPAGALAKGARNASPAAKKKNPRLNKVAGAKKKAKGKRPY